MLFFLFLTVLNAKASGLPPSAQSLLQELPEKKLTLDLVASRAMKYSDSYKLVKTEAASMDVPRLRFSGLTDPKLSLQAGWQDDQREPQTTFSPIRNRGTLYKAGISKYFLTGSNLKFELSHSAGDMTIPSIGQFEIAETRGTLSLSQNLWKDFLGNASKASNESAEKLSEANRYAVTTAQEDWFLDLAQIYYGAWLSQANYKSSLQSLKRKERLVKILDLRYKRGTSEAPAVLQVQSAFKMTQVEVDRAFQSMSDRWRALATVLKFPPEVEAVDPSLIPIDLGSADMSTDSLCKAAVPQSNAFIEKMRLLSEASLLNYEAAVSKKNPSLQFVGALGANAVEPRSSDSLSKFPRTKSPYLALGIEFSVPLGYSSENADLQTAFVDKAKGDASYQLSKDILATDWKNSCQEYLRLTNSRELLVEAFQFQTKRERLEEARFKLGRASTFEVIQAGDDAMSSELALLKAETELRLTVWKLQKMAGILTKYISGLEARQ